jgi:precorrin-8X/cobalt-precorrin-8 methylmutase
VIASYLRDPAEIAQRSFAVISAEADLHEFPQSLQPLVLRLAHAAARCDDPRQTRLVARRGPGGAASPGCRGPILVDARMVAAGIGGDRLPADNK